MSHFLVFVIGDNLDEQMEPFNENPPRDSAFIGFIEYTQYKNQYAENIVLEGYGAPDGAFYPRWVYPEHILPKHVGKLGWAEKHCQEVYPSCEHFLRYYHGKEPDRKTGLFGYWGNPNGHWDYYREYDEYLLLLPGKQHKSTSSALKSEIDLDKMWTERLIPPFAYVQDGQWHTRAKMGWWASTTNEKDYDAWTAEFAKMLKELPNDTLITVLDCHT